MDTRTPVKDLKQEPWQWTWRGKNRVRFVCGIEKLEDRVEEGKRSGDNS